MTEYTGPHDYFNQDYVNEWAAAANTKRPFRLQFFGSYVTELASLDRPKVLEIGSGPGFLAERVLSSCDVASYHLFDFSPHMHELCRARLTPFADKTVFHLGSFLEQGWSESLPRPFDAVVSLQTVHEVRDSALLPKLYRDIRMLLRKDGLLLIGDQVNDDERHEDYLVTLKEHEQLLKSSGFEKFRLVCAASDLAMFAANRKE
jgi:SAM-dependent methyltransferase